ncbi:hypothetical protein ASPZODRAFT_140341 [Penicilliopsis zonata CBS 506.65]|uniref:Probable E3 ubiquitin ligase complex SCF subunit sconB n=1 Tax=Penicilliopsis zonata CBS 506.65 TaxID=1073090 RepID=A0A1L9SQR0_9EURO|nr:hypothetical protein ASPZODRAFT_140341 [Penicilliopsis zonata CBS 506.65]OJJ49443.1 hypothetical protein ASPZODRAFT_140341 [Penicilliopsis zonata CBS 506.65]
MHAQFNLSVDDSVFLPTINLVWLAQRPVPSVKREALSRSREVTCAPAFACPNAKASRYPQTSKCVAAPIPGLGCASSSLRIVEPRVFIGFLVFTEPCSASSKTYLEERSVSLSSSVPDDPRRRAVALMDRNADFEADPPRLPRLPSPADSPSASLAASFRLDEGYSDDTTGSQLDHDKLPHLPGDLVTLPDWILAQTEGDRAELAYNLLRTLRTSALAAVVDRLNPLLHMDPVLKLPPEITSEIFSYLDPRSLLTSSLVSRAWRSRISDPRLWRDLFIREGWRVDIDAIRKYEQEQSEQLSLQSRKSRSRQADPDIGEPKLKKRVPQGWFESRGADSSIHAGEMDTTESGNLPDKEGDHQMSDASNDRKASFASQPPESPTSHSRAAFESARAVVQAGPTAQPFPPKSSIYTRLPGGTVKINWPHLYKQRRRLEENWLKGQFTNFQLPHPAHPEEAHQECVYTIQFSGKWLVSGSRDKTVRVWDLETQRLLYRPLLGHLKSVLCLQFDPSPSEDVIISGSSDKNVIVWQFSTGQKIHEISSAHSDSVLNLRFDKRYLVTCSKDRLIKVWNRRELTATDKDYPSIHQGSGVTYPSYIIDTTELPSPVLEAELARGHIKSLEPYSLLFTMDGHGAAVNAIQLNEDEIVSASGDRLIKVWNIRNGACLKTIIGHEKGIACIQFDSRRVISGSNDDTVRIFDHACGAEVACLHGHENLVRTVQAGFGDPPGAEETMRLEALAVDSSFWRAKRAGEIVDQAPTSMRRSGYVQNTAGSREPKDIRAIGANIPPGGGGSAWGRIVSGSYDETIIIWKKDREGRWVVSHRLYQEDAAAIASGEQAPIRPGTMHHPGPQQTEIPIPPPQGQGPQQPTPDPNVNVNHADAATGAGNATARPQQGNAWAQGMVRTNTLLPRGRLHAPNFRSAPAGHGPAARLRAPQHYARYMNHRMNNGQEEPPRFRVYKLQFDSRKIISASQDPRIVGWDFACGDREIIEACQFFQGL